MANGGGPVLGPPRRQGQGETQKPGLFTVDLGAVLWQKLRSDMPIGLMLGLLTKAPMPEGDRYEELAVEGYARQPLSLQDVSAQRYANNTIMAFGPRTTPHSRPTHAGAFDADGALLYYGAILPAGSGGASPYWMEFRAGAVRVKKSTA
jgi:hypothetical protein